MDAAAFLCTDITSTLNDYQTQSEFMKHSPHHKNADPPCLNKCPPCNNIVYSLVTANHSLLSKVEELKQSKMPHDDRPSISGDSAVKKSSALYTGAVPVHQCGSGSGSNSGQKKKSGSESSSGGSSSSNRSSHRRGGGGGVTGNGRGLSSSGDSDDNEDDDRKRGQPLRGHRREPRSKPHFLNDAEDDEATDSADEGGSEDAPEMMEYGSSSKPVTEGGGGAGGSENTSSFFNAAKHRGERSTVSAGSSTTISIESVAGSKEHPREGASATAPANQLGIGSPVNMSVGYVVPEALAARVMDKTTPPASGVGTPTQDSPRLLLDRASGRMTPGTPITSPDALPLSIAQQVSLTCTVYIVIVSEDVCTCV